MRIDIQRLDSRFHFLATNEAGNTVHMDSSPTGEIAQGAGPMQMLIMGLGGCSGIDIVDILSKSRQQIDDFRMELDYERASGETPALFTRVHAHYLLTGPLDVDKVRRAVELSLRKYCSVAAILEKSVPITYSFSVNGTRYEQQ
jgi:putative redox protein